MPVVRNALRPSSEMRWSCMIMMRGNAINADLSRKEVSKQARSLEFWIGQEIELLHIGDRMTPIRKNDLQKEANGNKHY